MEKPPSNIASNTYRRSQPARSRTPSYPSATATQLRRVPNGRIARARSVSAVQLNEQNRRAIWEAATDHTFHLRPVHLATEPEAQLTGLLTPTLLGLAQQQTTSSASNSSFASGDPLSSSESVISTSASSANSLVEVSLNPQGLKNSMEFMMPAQYGHFGAYPSSYQSSYMDQYSSVEQQQVMAQASPQPSSYAPSYTTSPPMMGSSPVTSQRSLSREREPPPGQQYQQVVPNPYDPSVGGAQGNYGYGAAPSQTAPSLQYAAGYQSTQDPYGSNTYGVGYSQVPSGYLPSQGSYGTQFPVSNPSQQAVPLSAEDASGVRVVTARPKPQCWEHGCNGRQFSTFSNLLRHQREKSGTAAKSECPRCGAVFTRTTARNGHLAHDKCKRKSTASASEAER